MKKVIIQLGNWILNHRKRLIYGALAFFVGQLCFFNIGGIGIENEVFADGNDNTATQNADFNKKAANWLAETSFFRKVIYFCLYPILSIMGKLVDNSWVYGEVFGFDAVLWNLWNIVRNMANFALGFIFIFYVFKYLITKNKSSDRKGLIMKSLIAGIGIQASRFLMAVLIDLSTVMTYGIGGLPISTLGGAQTAIVGGNDVDKEYYVNPYVPKVAISVDSDDIDTIKFYMSDYSGNNYISECETYKYTSSGTLNEMLLLAPKNIYYKYNNQYTGTLNNVCHYDGQIYYFEKLYDDIKWGTCDSNGSGCDNAQHGYEDSITTARQKIDKNKTQVKSLIEEGILLQIGDAHVAGGFSGDVFSGIKYNDGMKRGLDKYNKRTAEEWTGSVKRLNDMLDGSYVGTFTTLYTSLLDAGYNMRATNVSDPGLFVMLLNDVLSLLHMIAIGIPLLAMMVVLMMRICVLWMAIALSPVIVLLKAFGLDEKIKNDKDSIFSYISIDNLLPIIFSPVVVCFAISLSTVLVRIINQMNWRVEEITNMGDIMGGLIEVQLGGLPIKLSKLVIAAIGVAITWFLLWAAIEASKLGKSQIVQSLKNLATTALGSAPLVPVPTLGKDGNLEMKLVGASTASQYPERLMNQMETKMNAENEAAVSAIIDPEGAAKAAAQNAEKNKFETYKTGLKGLKINKFNRNNWAENFEVKQGGENIKFADLSPDHQKEIIGAIDREIVDEGVTPGVVKIGDITYEWKDGKYGPQTTSQN